MLLNDRKNAHAAFSNKKNILFGIKPIFLVNGESFEFFF